MSGVGTIANLAFENYMAAVIGAGVTVGIPLLTRRLLRNDTPTYQKEARFPERSEQRTGSTVDQRKRFIDLSPIITGPKLENYLSRYECLETRLRDRYYSKPRRHLYHY